MLSEARNTLRSLNAREEMAEERDHCAPAVRASARTNGRLSVSALSKNFSDVFEAHSLSSIPTLFQRYDLQCTRHFRDGTARSLYTRKSVST